MTKAERDLLTLVAENLMRMERQNSGPDSMDRRAVLAKAMIAVYDQNKGKQ